MKIFITGGTGFIGTHLVKKLQERGHNLLLLVKNQEELSFLSSHENMEAVEGELSTLATWDEKIGKWSPEACVHLAWENLPDYSWDVNRKNLTYGVDLISFLAGYVKSCRTIVGIGSAWDIRGRFPEETVDGIVVEGFESTIVARVKPVDTFSATKNMINLLGTAMIEEVNRGLYPEERKKFIWTRIFYVYGPGQRETSLIPYLINCAKKREVPEIKNLSAANDYIYIDDVAEAISTILENSQKSGEYEIGWGKLIANQDIVNIIAQEFGIRNWQKETGILENNKFVRPAENSGLRAIGWKPEINIKEGIKKTINYCQNQ